jgi:hypothetical protein
MSGGPCADIGISSTVGLDLLQAATAAFLIAARSSRRSASHLYHFAMETMSNAGMSRPGTPISRSLSEPESSRLVSTSQLKCVMELRSRAASICFPP